MNTYNLKKYMILYCKDGQIVILHDFTDSMIRVKYKDKLYDRPITIINEKLFFENPCRVSLSNKRIEAAASMGEDESTNQENAKQEKKCINCSFQHSGECSSWEVCDDFQPAYSVSDTEKAYWPQYGDATLFKRKRRKR